MIEYKVKVNKDGSKYWYLNGKLHREDGPAIEHSSGDKYWYLNDELHREDGPAIEYASGSKFWYLNGKYLYKDEWEKRIKKTHNIIIDGKEIELSDESFQNLKKAFDNS